MRLLNARTRKLEEFVGDPPEYAILSHTWEEEEVLFQDIISNPDVESKKGYRKIQFACDAALKGPSLQADYVWCDTCCIDKSSSAELSEAINSMWTYYRRSKMCFVHLNDVSLKADAVKKEGQDQNPRLTEELRKSRWFYRGWTLQELLAPHSVFFYNKDFKIIGSRDHGLLASIHDITGIPTHILTAEGVLDKALKSTSIAQRMSWAASRETSRIEDKAYCLLGLFNVNMPMLYGEGHKSFQRLQEEIIKTSTDHSFLARDSSLTGSLFARAPSDFQLCGEVKACGPDEPMESFSMTNRGLMITLPVLKSTGYWSTPRIIVALNCRERGKALTLELKQLTQARRQLNLPLEYRVLRARPGRQIVSSEELGRDMRTIIIVRDD